MKRDSARVIGEYLALVEKGDQATLIDFVARHPEELGSLSFVTTKPSHQKPRTDRRTATLQAAVLFVIVFFAFIFVAANLLPFGPDQGVSNTVALTVADGEVDILAAGTPGGETWQRAQAGASIKVGDSVRTGANAVAQLSFPDGSMTGLEAGTEVTVARLDPQEDGGIQVVLQQRVGRSFSRIQPSPDVTDHFRIETPSAVTSVRGTEFVVDVESGGTTRVVVIEGVVDVTAQEVTVAVQARQETTVEPAQSPAAAQPVSGPLPVLAFTPEAPAAVETPQAPGQPEVPKLTNTPKPTNTAKLTNTPRPTNTRQPSNTPRPTNTHRPTKEPQPPQEPKPTKGLKP